jgi:hypothetical protein
LVTLTDARYELTKWGRWWRDQEQKMLGYAPIGPGQKLIDLAKLGCRIQQSLKHDHSENIQVPPEHAAVDAVVGHLPQGQRAALTAYYIRNPTISRRKVKSRALLRAEVRIMQSL